MKFTKYLSFIFVVVLAISCEKGINTVHYKSTVYFPQSGLQKISVLLGESTYKLGVYNAGINQKDRHLKVTISEDKDAIDNYPEYKLLPQKYYEIPDNSIKIENGEARAFFKIKFKNITDQFKDTKYILPLKIAQINPQVGINKSKREAILYVSNYRNVYAGQYKKEGTITWSINGDTQQQTLENNVQAVSVNKNTIQISGPENGMSINLTVNSDGSVKVKDAKDESHNINSDNSSYSGDFSEKYQRNKGSFDLHYTYESEGVKKKVDLKLEFWLKGTSG
jgi:hypothetical protein